VLAAASAGSPALAAVTARGCLGRMAFPGPEQFQVVLRRVERDYNGLETRDTLGATGLETEADRLCMAAQFRITVSLDISRYVYIYICTCIPLYTCMCIYIERCCMSMCIYICICIYTPTYI
jgi:hypothetical protein